MFVSFILVLFARIPRQCLQCTVHFISYTSLQDPQENPLHTGQIFNDDIYAGLSFYFFHGGHMEGEKGKNTTPQVF
jgi:hypothetical protein